MSLVDIPLEQEQFSVCTICGNLFINFYVVVKIIDKNEAIAEMYEAIEEVCCKCGGYFEIADEVSDVDVS